MRNFLLFVCILGHVCIPLTSHAENMTDPSTSSLFEKWKDPDSGVESYILKKHIAPLQLSFYFTNTSYTNDGRYYWFYCVFPPSLGRFLGCLDFQTNQLHYFPETEFNDASPMVDLSTGEAYWISNKGLYKKEPGENGVLTQVNTIDIVKGRYSVRTATHLTFNAAKTSVNIDAHCGSEWITGEFPLDGSPFIPWEKFGVCYNHAQFSPVDSDLQLIAQDHWRDPYTGFQIPYKNRIWLIRKGEKAYPVYDDSYKQVGRHCHEWWSADGKRIYYVDYDLGTEYYEIATGKRVNVWPNGTCHSHCDKTGAYFVGDIGTYTWDKGCKVAFYNSETGKEIDIVSNLPVGQFGKRADPYHADPHPQFCFHDKYICYTTTVAGLQTVAFVAVEQLIRKTSEGS